MAFKLSTLHVKKSDKGQIQMKSIAQSTYQIESISCLKQLLTDN